YPGLFQALFQRIQFLKTLSRNFCFSLFCEKLSYMKKSFAIVFTVLSLFAFRPAAKAQLKGFSIGPYVEAALPVGDFGDFYKSGIGGGLGVDIKLPLTSLGITASA